MIVEEGGSLLVCQFAVIRVGKVGSEVGLPDQGILHSLFPILHFQAQLGVGGVGRLGWLGR